MIYRLLAIFLLAFSSNLVWENWHVNFYVNYQGGEITQMRLMTAAFFDAGFIMALSLVVMKMRWLEDNIWIAILFALGFAAGLEKFALATGRWEYNDLMPIIPIVNTGLSPTVQLALLFCMIFFFMNKVFSKKGC